MGRSPCCDEGGLKKGPWTPEEDEKLLQFIQRNGHGSWRNLPRLAGLNRCGKSCRLRWTNYLRPDIKRGKFSQDEEQTILHLHSILGNKWSAIATHLPGRTDNEIKNFWNTHLKKRLIQMGFDPMTHRPRTDFFDALPQLVALAALREQLGAVDQSAAVQLQGAGADVAFLQAAKLQYLQCLLQSAATTIACSAGSSAAAAVSAPDAEAALSDVIACLPQGTTTAGAAAVPASSTAGDHQMACTFSEEHVSDGANNQGSFLLSCGAGGFEYCHGGSLPPLADLSDAADGRCSATASSSFGGGDAGSPLPWPEFFPDDPFLTDFL